MRHIDRYKSKWTNSYFSCSLIMCTIYPGCSSESLKLTVTLANQQESCAPGEDSNQLGHLPSLISIFSVCLEGS